MTTPDTTRFQTPAPARIEPRQLTPLTLSKAGGCSPHLDLTDAGVVFRTEGWYEVLMDVHWDPANRGGTRFSHTKIPGQEPLHSEAINALVLAQLSEGRQLLRGNTVFGPERTSSLVLEVWHDADEAITVEKAGFIVRELAVPLDRRRTS